MKAFSRTMYLCIAAIYGLSSTEVGAQTSDFDPNVELDAILDGLVTPAAQHANDAIALASTDGVKACELAQSASSSIVEADNRLTKLVEHIEGEGLDSSPLAPFKSKIAGSVVQFAQLSKSVCSGEIAAFQANPATKTMASTIGSYINAYTNDVFAADAAEKSGDHTTYCAAAKDGKLQLDGITGYLVELRKTTSFSPGDAAALDELSGKIAGFTAQNETRLRTCPS